MSSARRSHASRVSEVFFTKSPSQAALEALEESRPCQGRGGKLVGKWWENGGNMIENQWENVKCVGKCCENVEKVENPLENCWEMLGENARTSLGKINWESGSGEEMGI